MIEKLEEDIEQMDSLTSLIADNTSVTQVLFSLVRSKGIGYISLCGYEGLSHDVFPSLIWSSISPTNNPLSLIPTYVSMPSSRSENYLIHLLIQIGRNDQVTSTLPESILQGLTPSKRGDDCVLPGNKYPYWLTFKGEGASVKFKVPRVNSCNLKGMTLCCAYFPSGVMGNMAVESLISLLMINYTDSHSAPQARRSDFL